MSSILLDHPHILAACAWIGCCMSLVANGTLIWLAYALEKRIIEGEDHLASLANRVQGLENIPSVPLGDGAPETLGQLAKSHSQKN